jgi:hypothetical protein
MHIFILILGTLGWGPVANCLFCPPFWVTLTIPRTQSHSVHDASTRLDTTSYDKNTHYRGFIRHFMRLITQFNGASVAKWLAHLPFTSKAAGSNLSENFSM